MGKTRRISYENQLEFLGKLARLFASEIQDDLVGSRLVAAVDSLDLNVLLSQQLQYGRISPYDAALARQCVAFFEKWEPLRLNIDREAASWDKFQEAERSCYMVNRSFKLLLSGGNPFPSDVLQILFSAARKIERVLGPVPLFDELPFAFGPGNSTTTSKQRTSPRWKLGDDISCSHELAPVVDAFLYQVPTWVKGHCVEERDEAFSLDVRVEAGRLAFVPKNAKIFRSILVEPNLNTFFQKGVGQYIRQRLLRYAGVNLNDQTINQRLAKDGSLTGHLATVDLSSASDTIAYELVAFLLGAHLPNPNPWWSVLSSLRTGKASYKGKTISLQKFSSMGNGFTFELETLIFWAIAKSVNELYSCTERVVSVYGDDIIVPSEIAAPLERVLELLGFSYNTEKSFSTGPFRESCGKDYHTGIDIRPTYVKDDLSDFLKVYSLHNGLLAGSWDLVFPELPKLIQGFLRKHGAPLLFGPVTGGDGHLHSRRFIPSSYNRNRGWCGHRYDTFVRVPRKTTAESKRGDPLLPAYAAYVGTGDQPVDHNVLRGSVGYKRMKIYTF